MGTGAIRSGRKQDLQLFWDEGSQTRARVQNRAINLIFVTSRPPESTREPGHKMWQSFPPATYLDLSLAVVSWVRGYQQLKRKSGSQHDSYQQFTATNIYARNELVLRVWYAPILGSFVDYSHQFLKKKTRIFRSIILINLIECTRTINNKKGL